MENGEIWYSDAKCNENESYTDIFDDEFDAENRFVSI